MKHVAGRSLSRSTLWRRRRAIKFVKFNRKGPRHRGGRRFISIEHETERLLLAAAVIQLAFEHGVGGFTEDMIKTYPRSPAPPSPPVPYPADSDILHTLSSSRLPASLLLVQAIDKCKPAPINAALEQAGAKYARRHVPCPLSGDTRDLKCLRLILQSIYQQRLSRGYLPDRARSSVVTKLLIDVVINRRMRSYWQNHAKALEARQLVSRFVTKRARRQATETFLRTAEPRILLMKPPLTVKEYYVAFAQAQVIFEEHRPRFWGEVGFVD